MSERIGPALTAEEWAKVLPGNYQIYGYDDGGTYAANEDFRGEIDCTSDRHALAALALYGQPFGFTREDLQLLEWAAEAMYDIAHEHSQYAEGEADKAKVLQLRARIEVLLPPDKEGT